ncbi:MAG: LemA family protein [Bacillota bacterium]|jgi:LemA protein|nr:MAG: LemA family protein [Bacillota bacterium]
MYGWIVPVAIAAIALLTVVGIYNRLIILRNRVANAWAQIDVQLKRRADLVPNLVETVKGYVKHERGTLEAVTKARAAVLQGGTVGEQAQANDMLTNALKSVFAVAEAYPDLKANQNFLMLQEELSGIENKIAYARQFYNDSVLSLNQATQVFPSNMVASMFGIRQQEYFEAEGADREPVQVKF